MNFLTRFSSISLILVLSTALLPAYPRGGLLTSDTPIRITAVDLASAYDKDEKAADREYKGRLLEITGVISSVSLKEGPAGELYILVSLHSLAGPPGKIPYVGDITCVFKNPRKSSAAQLKKGRKVIIQGVCEGVVVIGVFLEDCTIVSPSKSLALYLKPSAAI